MAEKLKGQPEEAQIALLRHHHPAEYCSSLKAMERKEELAALCGDRSEEYFTWEIFANILPELNAQEESNALQEVTDMDVEISRYTKFVGEFS